MKLFRLILVMVASFFVSSPAFAGVGEFTIVGLYPSHMYSIDVSEGALIVDCQNHPGTVAKDIVYAENGDLVSFTCTSLQYLCALINPDPDTNVSVDPYASRRLQNQSE